MSEYKEFWIAQGSLADIVCYNEKQAIDLQWTKNPIHVIEYAAFEKLQKDWEEAATKNYADKCEIEKLKKQNEIMRDALKRVVRDNLHSDHYADRIAQSVDRGLTALQALKDVEGVG